MSFFGLSTYVLVTRKGKTRIPLCRGTSFAIAYRTQAFFRYHMIAAGHVVRPHKHQPLYGNPPAFVNFGDRHMSYKAHFPTPCSAVREHADSASSSTVTENSVRTTTTIADTSGESQKYFSLDVAPKIRTMPQCHVVTLRLVDEATQLGQLAERGIDFTPFEIDMDPIADGTKLTFAGMDAVEACASVGDATLELLPKFINVTTQAAYVSRHFCTVLLATVDNVAGSSPIADGGDSGAKPGGIPLSFAGGPVLRNGRVVGVVVAPLRTSPQTEPGSHDPAKKLNPAEEEELERAKMMESAKAALPLLDVSGSEDVLRKIGPHAVGGAFVPIAEFIDPLRRQETI